MSWQPYSTKAIDNAGPYNITAKTYCRRILVQENFNSANPPTADLQQYNADGTGPVAIAKGTPAIFAYAGDPNQSFIPNQVVGQINTVSGSITIQQIEGDRV